MPPTRKITRAFYARDTLTVARELIGMHLVRANGVTRRVGRIVETEAYQGPEDLAAHSSRGRTPRTEVMFGPPGSCLRVLHLWLLALPEHRDGSGGGATRRVAAGVGARSRDRGQDLGTGPALPGNGHRQNAERSGPRGDVLWLEKPTDRTRPQPRIARSARIGVDYAGEWARRPWRFSIKTPRTYRPRQLVCEPSSPRTN